MHGIQKIPELGQNRWMSRTADESAAAFQQDNRALFANQAAAQTLAWFEITVTHMVGHGGLFSSGELLILKSVGI